VGPDRVPRCDVDCGRRASFPIARASGGMADAHGSGPCVRKDVGVQLPPCPPQVVIKGPVGEFLELHRLKKQHLPSSVPVTSPRLDHFVRQVRERDLYMFTPRP
jgi:hypothetical protein